MGQIFDRINRIAKSYLAYEDELESARQALEADSDFLKEEIDNCMRDNYSNKKSDNRQKKQNINDINDEINLKNSFNVLGVPENASAEEIKAAYKTKIKEYHPDKVEGLGEELKSLAAKKTQDINAAYNYLKQIKNFN